MTHRWSQESGTRVACSHARTSSARPPSTSASYSGPREVLGSRGKLSGSCLTRCFVSHSPPDAKQHQRELLVGPE